jgi:signal transduction histidine kinase/CheY-like chemotaxis protein
MINSPRRLSKSYEILLVEDDLNYAKLVQILLSESELLSAKITHCTSLQAAIQQLKERENHFAAVLLDLSLPDSQGFATLSRLIFEFPKLNIIVMTAQSDKCLALEAVKAGAQDFLIKGEFDTSSLSQSLRYAIERSNILIRLEETQRLARIGHWECSPSERIFVASEEVYHIFGYPRHKSVTCHEIEAPDSPLSIILKTQAETISQGTVQKDMWITTLGGGKRFVTLVCTASKTAGEHYLFNGIIQDITERKQAEELKKARDLAQHIANEREQFIASISHEMRTPMNAILGMSNLLLDTRLAREQAEYTKAIKQSSEVLLHIINDILDASAIQNDQLKLTVHPFALHNLMDQVIGLMSVRAKEKKLRLIKSIAPDVPAYLEGDSIRLKQVLYNLIGNAIKFTDSGTVEVAVCLLSQEDQAARLQFRVTDTGIGIKEEDLTKIFMPFSRITHKDRIYEGTGLGLAIAKSLVESQGGQIEISSTPGQGTSFYFGLAFKQLEGAQMPAIEELVFNQKDSTQDFSLLLVEDHKLNQTVAQKTLERLWANINIIIANDGDEAIQILEDKAVDIILMDIQMPKRDGFETTQYIRDHIKPDGDKIPILAMTAHANIEGLEQFKNGKFDGFILKPFTPDQLHKSISPFLSPQTA